MLNLVPDALPLVCHSPFSPLRSVGKTKHSCSQAASRPCIAIKLCSADHNLIAIVNWYKCDGGQVSWKSNGMMFARNARDWGLIPCWSTEFFRIANNHWIQPTVTFGVQCHLWARNACWHAFSNWRGKCDGSQVSWWSNSMMVTQNARDQDLIPHWDKKCFWDR